LGWLNLPHLPILPQPVTAKQRVVMISDQPEEGYGVKDLENRNVLRQESRERSTSGPGSEHGDGEELDDDDG